jgi:hypothetical protein
MDQHLTAPVRAVLCALALSGAPAWAQEEVPDDSETENLHLPGYEGPTNRSWVEFEIAPALVSHNSLERGSETTNALDLSLTLGTRQPLGDLFEVQLEAGASKTIDNGSFSELAAAVELRTRPGPSGFSGFVSYDVSRDFTAFFEHDFATTHVVSAGARYGTALGVADIGFELEPRWHESTGDAADYGAVNLWGEAVLPVADPVLLIVNASLERRWYAHEVPFALVKRRDWRFATFVGLDFAGLIRSPSVRDLSVGVEWLEVSSNIDLAERSDLALLPAVSVGFAF